MVDEHAIIRKFERMMEATHEELMERGKQPSLNKKDSKIIGHFVYDFETKTEKFVYAPKYRLIRFVNTTYSKMRDYFSRNKNSY